MEYRVAGGGAQGRGAPFCAWSWARVRAELERSAAQQPPGRLPEHPHLLARASASKLEPP